MSAIWAIIPVKSLAETKSRLTAVLSPADRAALTIRLLRRTLQQLQACDWLAGSIVVSRDRRVAAVARALGAQRTAERADAGLNGAVVAGAVCAGRLGAAAWLIIPSDLPYLRSTDLDLLQRAWAGASGTAVLAGDDCQDGTNGLLLPALPPFRFQYGPGSFTAHLAEIRRCGLIPAVVESPGLQFDLDTAADWRKYQAHPAHISSTQSA